MGRGTSQPDQEWRHLAQANRHIADAKKFVARQRQIVERVKAKGSGALADALVTLDVLEATLQELERHRQLILTSIERSTAPA